MTEFHFKKSNVFLLAHMETANREFMGDFCAHLAKMHPLWTITSKRPQCKLRKLYKMLYEIRQNTA